MSIQQKKISQKSPSTTQIAFIAKSEINYLPRENRKHGLKNLLKKQGSLKNPENVKSVKKNIRTTRIGAHIRNKIEEFCGSMQILGSNDVPIKKLYVDLHTLTKPMYMRYRDLDELNKMFQKKYSDDQWYGIKENRQSWETILKYIEKRHLYPKIMLLGTPGSGKTTFLKYLALLCSRKIIKKKFTAFFLRWSDIKDVLLLSIDKDEKSNIQDSLLVKTISHLYKLDIELVSSLFDQGKVFLLLDGLDEITGLEKQLLAKIIDDVKSSIKKYHKIHTIISCRTAAKEYSTFDHVDYVQLAEFSQEQIKAFVTKWFASVNSKTKDGKIMAEKFMKTLEKDRYEKLQHLFTTPILLNLACWIFQDTGDLPHRKVDFYEQGIELLIKKWDEKKQGIQRPGFLKEEQEKKLLSQIAYSYSLTGEVAFLDEDLASKIKRLSSFNSNQVFAAIHNIEMQHGLLLERASRIYTFSHLSFQEYFTALYIFHLWNKQTSKSNINQIYKYLNEFSLKSFRYESWDEIMFFFVEMLHDSKRDEFFNYFSSYLDSCVKSNNTKLYIDWAKKRVLKDNLGNNLDNNLQLSVEFFYIGLIKIMRSGVLKDSNLGLDLDKSLDKYINLLQEIAISNDQLIDFNLVRLLYLQRPQDRTRAIEETLMQINDTDEILKSAIDNLKNYVYETTKKVWFENVRNIVTKQREFPDWTLVEDKELTKYFLGLRLFMLSKKLSKDRITKPNFLKKPNFMLIGDANKARERGDFLRSLQITDEAFLDYNAMNDIRTFVLALSSRFYTLRLLYEQSHNKNYLISALYTSKATITIAKKSKHYTLLSQAHFDLAKALEDSGEVKSAKNHYCKAYIIASTYPDSGDHRQSIIADMRLHLATCKYNLAKHAALKAATLKDAETAVQELLNSEEISTYNKDVWLSGGYMRIAEMLCYDKPRKAKMYLQKAKKVIDANPHLFKLRLPQWQTLASYINTHLSVVKAKSTIAYP